MIDFAALMNFAFENRLYESEVHGIEHWHQVEYNGMLLAQKTGADIDVVRLFAIFHDCRRFDDAYDRDHGARGAEFAKLCREEKRFELDDERFGWLYDACRLHTIQSHTGIITIDTCFDADRLDLGRVGLSGHFDALSNAALKDVGVPQGNAAVDMTLRYFAKDGLAKARLIVSEQAKKYAEEAANAVETRSEQEYQRMNHLLSMRGKAGTSEALKQLRKNVQERKKVVSNPQLRLDAIRLVVCK